MSEHGLNEHDILAYHHSFDRKSPTEQNQWLIQYFGTHCPSNSEGGKDFKSMLYIVQGKKVCANLWQEVLCLSVARFYRLRRQFLDFGDTTSAAKEKRRRALAPKTREAVAWMEHYFDRIGDKRPDKDAILLPTCLTERKIYQILVDELYHGDSSNTICFSQFNKIYRSCFTNVSIPKVHIALYVTKS